MFTSRTFHTCGHDPGPGSGDHHPSECRHGGGEVPGAVVDGVIRQGAGRAEDGDLPFVSERAKDPERLGHFPQGRAGSMTRCWAPFIGWKRNTPMWLTS